MQKIYAFLDVWGIHIMIVLAVLVFGAEALYKWKQRKSNEKKSNPF